ncbi:adenosine deaminase [Rhodobacterales bacterium HKCCE3408]|nr:adenosine deaminase [Rhodobacterales bacterium HKCCE3408]
MSVSDLPKIELHLHLEGAAPPDFIRRIADEKKRRLHGVFAEDGSYSYRDFNHFLRVYEEATSVLTTPQDYARLVTAVCEELAEHGVVYAETFLSPDFCGGGDVAAWREYLAAMTEAADGAEAKLGVTLRGIVTAIRHFGPERSKAPAICAAETQGRFLRGFGLAGDELQFAPKDFLWAFDCAREAGLHITAHAGEWGGARSVRDTLEALNPERIGHGVQAIEDPELVDILAERGTVLEVCPGSNVFLGVFRTWPKHPVERLREKGVKVTISTDDPPFFHTNMSREYVLLNEHFGWDEEIFKEVNRTALDAAFCDEETRAAVAKRLEGE